MTTTKELSLQEMENLQGGIYDPINDVVDALNSGTHNLACALLIGLYNSGLGATVEQRNEWMTQAIIMGC